VVCRWVEVCEVDDLQRGQRCVGHRSLRVALPDKEQGEIDLSNERKKSTFTSSDLSLFVYGKERLELKKKMIDIIVNDPVLKSDENIYFMSRTELYKYRLTKFKRVRQLFEEGKLSFLNKDELYTFIFLSSGFHAMGLHEAMFLPTLRGQADEEQAKYWIPLAENYKIVGCYAQTELGHGSNVRGIETTATFDVKTDEIVLHSPTLTSTKWWPGALGRTATHAIVYANLIVPVPGQAPKNYGVHPFIVQLRDLDTHKNLPGITSGDIGPKFGSNSNDNGFLRLHQVRIPRRNMLMKHSKLTREGEYQHKESTSKLSYGTMLMVRAGIVGDSAIGLSKACTIAIRYCCVRRQFNSPDSGAEGLEQQVIDFPSVQYRLFPLLATAYALQFTSQYMISIYKQLQKGLSEGDISALAEVHATSSGLKAISTIYSSEGIEECRKSCGGHGYSSFSGLGDLFTGYVSNNTLEGENYMIIQQTTRFLLKALRDVRSGKKQTGNISYLNSITDSQTCYIKSRSDLRNPEFQLNAYALRSYHVLSRYVNEYDRLLKEKKSESASQALQWLGTKAAKAHCLYTIVWSFATAVEKSKGSPLYAPLSRLRDLFALYNIEKEMGDFLEDNVIAKEQAGLVREEVRQILLEIRPDCVNLVDAFGYHDYELNSALGRYDGKVYTTLYNWAQKEPLNQGEVVPGYEDTIKQILKGFSNSKL